MHPHVLIERDPGNSHAARGHIADERNGSECGSGISFEAVDNILIGGYEHA